MSNKSGFAILVTHLTAMAFGCEVHFPVCWCRNAALKSITPSLKRRPGCLFSEYAGWAYLEQVSWAKLHLLALSLGEHLNKLPSIVDDFLVATPPENTAWSSMAGRLSTRRSAPKMPPRQTHSSHPAERHRKHSLGLPSSACSSIFWLANLQSARFRPEQLLGQPYVATGSYPSNCWYHSACSWPKSDGCTPLCAINSLKAPERTKGSSCIKRVVC